MTSGKDIPAPDTEYGHTWGHLKSFLTEAEYERFGAWMDGQTQALVDGKAVVYEHDLRRFLAGLPVID